MGIAVNFSNNKNQMVWESWFNRNLAECGIDINDTKSNDAKSKRISLSQYKPIIRELEDYTKGIAIDDVSLSTLVEFTNTTTKTSKLNHLKGYMIANVKEFNFSKDVIAWLIPQEYKELVNMLLS